MPSIWVVDVSSKNQSIAKRIGRLVIFTSALAMAIVTLILAAYHVENSVAARRAELVSTSYVYASAIAEELAAKNREGIDQVFHSTTRLHDVVGVYALSSDGEVLSSAGHSVILTDQLTARDANLFQVLASGLMPVSVDVVRSGAPVGKLVMIGDISMIRTELAKSIAATLVAGLVALAFAQFLSTRLLARVTAPITQLTQTITTLTAAHRYEPAVIPNAIGETGELVASFNGMIGEIRSRDEAMRKLAYFDPRTGLPNRSQFLEALATAFELGQAGFAICILDIDGFSTINGTLGETSADALLTTIATQLESAKQEGHFLARLGADEFVLIAPNCSTLDAAQRALAPYVASFYAPVMLNEQTFHISAGVGIALSGIHGETPADILRHAGLALVEAKRQGTGRIVSYFPELGERIDEEADIERGLRQAVSNGELEVHYQPIVNVQSTRVEGFEALMRWRRSDGRFVSPAKFIPVAEKAGLIAELGQWILRRACKDAAQWIAAGHKPRFVSVNISASQILLSDFLPMVKTALSDSGLPPHLLCLELTESLFVGRSINLVRALLLEAKSFGILTALDDFGTGYSSLSYLENLPFDKLKIDRSFVHQERPGTKTRPLLKGIVDLAHALNISIVAEGVEAVEEVQELRSLGAQAIQGYFYSRPLPQLEALVAAARIEAAASDMQSGSRHSGR